MRLAGVDGCKAGWVVASRWADGPVAIDTRADFAAILAAGYDLIAIDIPIGLPREPRSCDREARRLLGPRRGSSIFPAPIREVLAARSYAEANEISSRVGNRKISQQCWNIVPKIREVDCLLEPGLQERVFEVHPEVSFRAANYGKPILENKKTAAGQQVRRQILETQGVGPQGLVKPGGVAPDDLHDALIALWSAQRLVTGVGQGVTDDQTRDARGLSVNIWY